MTKKIRVIDNEVLVGQYDMSYTRAIIEHPKHGRLLIVQGFGGMDSLSGGAYRWRHGLVCKLKSTDTLKSLNKTEWSDAVSLYDAVIKSYDDTRPLLLWRGNRIDDLAISVGL